MSEPTNGNLLPDWTPEEKAAIYAEMKKRFTVEDLLGYINDEVDGVPLDDVIAKAGKLIREIQARKQEAGK